MVVLGPETCSARMKFLIAEDHELVSSTLMELLKFKFGQPTVHWISTSTALLACFQKEPWDLLLLDIELADTTSLELIPQLKKLRPKCRILVYSGHPEKIFGMQAIKAGADGFIHKTSPTSEFVTAINSVLQSRKYVSAEVALGLVQAYQGSHDLENEAKLSAREFQVMCSIASGKFNNEIAVALGLSEKTVSTYRTRVLTKLGLRTNADLTKHALRMGYIQ